MLWGVPQNLRRAPGNLHLSLDLRSSEGSQHKPVDLDIVCSGQAAGAAPSDLRRADVRLANDLVAEILHSCLRSLVQRNTDVSQPAVEGRGWKCPDL